MNTQLNDSNENGRRIGLYKAILLIILLVYIAIVHYGLHANAHLDYDRNAPVQWLQPASLDDTSDRKPAPLIGNSNWRLNYVDIEEVVWKSKLNASGSLLIDSDTAELLEQAYARIPDAISPEELQRLTFLTKKSLPGHSGEQLAELLTSYYFYQQHYQAILSAINNAKEDERLLLLQAFELKNKYAQERYFGVDIAIRLFDKRNITTNYLNQRRIVNMRKDLTQAQRKQRLSVLQEEYKNTLSN